MRVCIINIFRFALVSSSSSSSFFICCYCIYCLFLIFIKRALLLMILVLVLLRLLLSTSSPKLKTNYFELYFVATDRNISTPNIIGFDLFYFIRFELKYFIVFGFVSVSFLYIICMKKMTMKSQLFN